MAHDQLRLDLVDRIHRNAYDNQQRCSPKIEINVQPLQNESHVEVGESRIDPVADQPTDGTGNLEECTDNRTSQSDPDRYHE